MARILNFLEEHRDWVVELLRMYLGVVLFVKGLQFMQNMSGLLGILGMSESSVWASGVLGHYIMLAHLVGGIFVFLGLLTRYACVAQIPILAGGVFLLAVGRAGLEGVSLEYTIAVFLLLVMFLFYGGGRISADYYLEKRVED